VEGTGSRYLLAAALATLVLPAVAAAKGLFMQPGQRFWNGRKVQGGWYRASARLKAVLVRVGRPVSVL